MVKKITMSQLKYAPVLVFQIIVMILYIFFTDYGGDRDSSITGFGETHVMIFIGFAYLMTFLKKYSYSALGFNWLLAALAIQWALLCQNFFHMKDGTIFITKKSMLEADIMTATVLITFGALLGLASGVQLLFISIVEIAIGCTNIYLNEEIYKISDVGGSISIHAYGAYFGLGVSAALRMKKPEPPANQLPRDSPPPLDGATYTSDVTAMLGSIFLWIYWPFFNSALTSGDAEYQRAIINTYLALASCAVTTFVLSAALSHKPGKLDMVHIQNSTLAGGVGVGAVANLFIGPGVAVAIGIGAAFISVFGYRFLTPALEKLGVQDTCGVNNLHGMPGLYSGLLSVLFAALATSDKYGTEMSAIFPATVVDPADGVLVNGLSATTEARTMGTQALYQLLALATTLGLGLGSGIITGLIAKTPVFGPLEVKQRYDDEMNWELP